MWKNVGVATPAERRGEYFLGGNILAVRSFQKSAGERCLSGVRGAQKFSDTFRIVLRILFFCVFQTIFRIDFFFRGQLRSADMPRPQRKILNKRSSKVLQSSLDILELHIWSSVRVLTFLCDSLMCFPPRG